MERGLEDVAVSLDSHHVSAVSSSEGAVSWFGRDPDTGDLTYDGCYANATIDGASGIIQSPVGDFIYVLSGADKSITFFTRDSGTGILTCMEKDMNVALDI